MKKISFIFSLFVVISSCSKSDIDNFPQKWQLATQMAYQESYILNSDGTFIKTRELNGTITKASGTFQFEKTNQGKLFLLDFATQDPIIESCSGTREILSVKSDKILLSTWPECDGSSLEFHRID